MAYNYRHNTCTGPFHLLACNHGILDSSTSGLPCGINCRDPERGEPFSCDLCTAAVSEFCTNGLTERQKRRLNCETDFTTRVMFMTQFFAEENYFKAGNTVNAVLQLLGKSVRDSRRALTRVEEDALHERVLGKRKNEGEDREDGEEDKGGKKVRGN